MNVELASVIAEAEESEICSWQVGDPGEPMVCVPDQKPSGREQGFSVTQAFIPFTALTNWMRPPTSGRQSEASALMEEYTIIRFEEENSNQSGMLDNISSSWDT